MTAWTDDTDPFGTLARVPDGIVLPELSLSLYDRRDNITATLPWVRNMVAATGLSEWFEERIAERKKALNPDTKAGRPRDVTVEAILVAWFMGKFARNSFLHSETARFLLSTLTDAERADLGVPLVHRDPTAAPMLADRRVRLDKDAVGKHISRLSKQMDDLINPSRYNQAQSRIKTVDKETLLRDDVTAEDLADAQARLDWVTLQITSLPIKMMPRWLRRQYKGDGCVDDTPIRLASSKENTERIAWDITGGTYMRTKPTSDRDARKTKAGQAKGRKTGKGGKDQTVKVITKAFHAHDAALVIACDATPGPRQYFPTIPLGFTLHAAGFDPAGNSKRVFDLLAETGIAKRHMSGDRLYPWQVPEKFHLPLIEHGWGPVFDYRIDTLGRQGFAPGGLLLVEGQFHCPLTPDAAIEATRDLRNGTIDHDTYKARMAVRESHRLHEKEKPDHNGTSRCECPAAGNSPKVKCPLREDSLQPHVIPQPDRSQGDTRLVVQLLPTRFKEAAADEAKTDAETKAKAAGADDQGRGRRTGRRQEGQVRDAPYLPGHRQRAPRDPGQAPPAPHLRQRHAQNRPPGCPQQPGRLPRVRQGRRPGSDGRPGPAPQTRPARPEPVRRHRLRRRVYPQDRLVPEPHAAGRERAVLRPPQAPTRQRAPRARRGGRLPGRRRRQLARRLARRHTRRRLTPHTAGSDTNSPTAQQPPRHRERGPQACPGRPRRVHDRH